MNELKLEFQLETTEIPAELDKVLVSFLKATIENYSPALFEKLYNKNSSILKKYTWQHACLGQDLHRKKYYLTRSDLL